ncbi:MAG: S-layer protein domain-containing protein [Methanothrix sp.]|nr:S-layer protein domain-containing protein [Methanothrix sp.]MDD4448022.1 S-layer protein domain-containing protein [Methanothrix sp.]
MDHVRVGGVCLLLILLAAALPINVLAQTPSEDNNAADGAAPIISQSLLSKSTQGETISAEKLAKRNTGLKPLSSSGQATKSETTAAPEEAANTASFATESNANQETASQEPAQDATVTPDMIQTEASVEPPAEPSAEPIAEPSAITNDIAAADQTAEVAAETTIAPPEEVALGTTVSADATATSISDSQNTSQTETEIVSNNVSENKSENATQEEAAPAVEETEETSEPADRIWREGISSDKYTWDYRSFSGFFYDMKNNVGTERLTVDLQGNDRSIDSGNLVYSTTSEKMDFEFSEWGEYQVIGFMAEKYFAGYLQGDGEIFDNDVSLINDGQLRRVLVDSDDESTITTGSVLTLEEGYELRIKQIDIDGNKVYLGLAKDGEEIDSKVVSPDSSLKSATYLYKVEISGEDQPIIMAHISNVFASTESDLVTVDGIFQISDTYNSVESGDEYGKMQVNSLSDTGLEMDNDNTISLRKGGTAEIFGDVKFIVADSDELRFAPIVERSGPQEVRGTVINPSEVKEFTWTVYNFEGFYYDIDDDVGTEELTAKITGGSKIEEGDLLYSTSPAPVEFEFASWGKYDVVGFMADKYFAGFNNETKFTDEVSAINEGQLRKVLTDDDNSRTIASGSVLSLEEGYELRIKQVDLNGNKVYLALARDGEEVDSKVVTPSSSPGDKASNYMYKVDIGSEKDVPIIIVHVESVFRSTESDLATVDGIFQVSDSPESVEEGEIHGRMKVETLGDDGITMKNDGSISLGRDKTIEIMENLKFRIADSSDRLMAPIAIKPGEGSDMTLSVPAGIVNTPVIISVKSGTSAISGVQFLINGSSLGTADATGSFTYTPTSVGTYPIVAKKTGYNEAKADLVVRTASEAAKASAFEKANATLANQLTINAPAEVIKGENFLITVVEGINQTPVDAASLFLDEGSIGSTGAQGTMTYSAIVMGEHTLKAEKEGFNSATKMIKIASSLRIVNLTVPDKANAGSEIKISAIVENVGSNEDTRLLEIKANETVVDSKNATVKGGENTTVSFSYKPVDPGLTRISLDEQSKTVNVEKAESKNWIIALILVLLIAIGAGYYLYSTGELDGLQRQVKKMMQGR